MKSKTVWSQVTIGIVGLKILWDIIQQVRTGTEVTSGDFLLALVLIILIGVVFPKKKPS